MITLPVLVVGVLVIVVMVFIPVLRGVVSLFVRLAIFAIGVAVAAAGVAMIMNNETIFEKPGATRRVMRFVTMNSAAASASGLGSVTCDMGANTTSQPESSPTPGEHPGKRHAATRST